MSFHAMAWAAKLHVGRASDKLILLAFADRHNEETGYAYPSIAWLAEFSSLDRKTVITSVDRLVSAGHLTDTGKRTGTTKQIKVYSVNVETVPKPEQSRKRNSTEIGGEQSRKRYTEPVRNLSTSEAKASSVVRQTTRRRFVPDEWQPKPSHVELAQTMGLDLHAQTEAFRNHEFKDPKSDFDRAFFTWLRNAPTFAPRAQNGPSAKLAARHDNYHDSYAGYEQAAGLLAARRAL